MLQPCLLCHFLLEGGLGFKQVMRVMLMMVYKETTQKEAEEGGGGEAV